MKRRIVLAACLLLGLTTLASAQGRQGMPHRYDATTETTLTGTVEEVLHPQGPQGMVGVHLNLKSESGMIEVHVGPENYLKAKGVSFERGDTVTVTGSKQLLQGKDSLIAKEVKKGDQVLTLRNADGTPKWSRRGGPSS